MVSAVARVTSQLVPWVAGSNPAIPRNVAQWVEQRKSPLALVATPYYIYNRMP